LHEQSGDYGVSQASQLDRSKPLQSQLANSFKERRWDRKEINLHFNGIVPKARGKHSRQNRSSLEIAAILELEQ